MTRDLRDLLGTFWRHRGSGEVGVVLRVAPDIHIIDVDWEPKGSFEIVDRGAIGNEPKHWFLSNESALRRDWQRLRGDWTPADDAEDP